jgi:guanylate kinase
MNLNKLQKQGTLFVVSAPSGTGKSTLIKEAMQKTDNLNFSVSYTTREKRANEQHGKDYFFVSDKEFEQMIEKNMFLEYAKVFDKFYYGTSKIQVEDALNKGRDIIMDIDVQGACQIMDNKTFPFVSIFILPPSMTELRNRLEKRGRESIKEIQKRLQVAENEIKYLSRFDYLVINDCLDKSSEDFLAIIKAERLKINKFQKTEQLTDIFKE